MKNMNQRPQEFLIFYSRILRTRARQTTIPKPPRTNWPPDAENRVHPRNQRAVADIRDQYLRLILKPLLIPKKQENNYHRCANQVVIKIVFENTELNQCIYKNLHHFTPLLNSKDSVML